MRTRKMSTRANQQMGILGPMDMDIVGVGWLGSKGVGVWGLGLNRGVGDEGVRVSRLGLGGLLKLGS